ncbi:1,4-dihydroxy-2-naphthoate octaprenyltransferase [Kibdelosporangium banguiense]|uniref:Cytochrome c oxidase polypeptide 4 n=1 Tax=Kibdelosporangium banguiense TaxID=1365924 RepID=A0ABS4U4L9_9PSEU|nr:cytochrome c oxidase subunit 4 [Kibdelosporangium banguiense]MBP2331151.1 1,4-dihydroxy-2-naphthoate octaprenyltransferase [Kibdelosporangium banguiense]
MKVEAKIFHICTAFFFFAAILYGLWAKEVVGIVGLTLTGGLSLIIGSYFSFVSRRVEQRPEDNPEAEVSDGAGELGFFSPGSYWPVGLAASAALTGFALAFFHIWLLVIGIVCILLTVGGLVFEYHTAPDKD